MKPVPDRSLKSLNITWLVMLAVLDMIVVVLFVAPEVIKETTWNQLAVMRGLATGFSVFSLAHVSISYC